ADLLIAAAAIGLATAGRLVVDIFAPGVAPFAFVFPFIILASLVAGARAGMIAATACLILIWYFVIPPARPFEISATQAIGLFVAAFSLFLAVAVISAFRSTVLRLREEERRHVEFLSLALREVDHRTRNNFQIAASLLISRAMSHADPDVQDELRAAAGRLQSLASVYSNLALSSADLTTVLLHDHLRDVCDRIREAMLPPGITLSLDAEPMQVAAKTAVAIALIVNEAITNATKHAFPGGLGDIALWVRREGDGLVVTIEDNGVGRADAPSEKGHGSGASLMQLLARSLHATLEISAGSTIDQGTRCELRVPAQPD
ncbi:MAG: sensor histidine kinase, partial [Alphaproteobacteria bacterium]